MNLARSEMLVVMESGHGIHARIPEERSYKVGYFQLLSDFGGRFA